MNKAAAIDAFDTVTELAATLGISRQAIYKWPDELPPRIADRVIAAAVRAGRQVPQQWLGDRASAEPSKAAA